MGSGSASDLRREQYIKSHNLTYNSSHLVKNELDRVLAEVKGKIGIKACLMHQALTLEKITIEKVSR